jgi:hypothetical protein
VALAGGDFDGALLTRRTDPALEVQTSHHQAGGLERGERGLQNLNAFAAAGRASEFGAENCGGVLLQVREIGDQLETEQILAGIGGSCGGSWCGCSGDGA